MGAGVRVAGLSGAPNRHTHRPRYVTTSVTIILIVIFIDVFIFIFYLIFIAFFDCNLFSLFLLFFFCTTCTMLILIIIIILIIARIPMSYAMRTNKSTIVYGYAFESVKEGTVMRPGAGVGGGRGNVVDSRR